MANCSLHPTQPAHWHCPRCRIDFCGECITRLEASPMSGKKILRTCPKCAAEVNWVGGSSIITPFWARLHKFFIYPLKPGPVIFMALLALGSLVYWSMIVQFICWVLMLNYAFVSLKRTAAGMLTPPPLLEDLATGTFIDVIVPVIKQAILFVLLLALAIAIFAKFGIIALIIYGMLAIFMAPSMIIIMVNSESLLTALNPAAFLFLPAKIGKGYLIMFFFLGLLFFAPAFLLQFLSPVLPKALYGFVMAFAQNYYTLVTYHLMGYFLLQYHEILGYEIGIDDIRDGKKPVREKADDPAALVLKRVEPLISEGQLDEAIEHLEKWHEQGGAMNFVICRRYFQLLQMRRRTPAMLKFAPVYMAAAFEEGRKTEALDAYQSCMAEDEGFDPGPPVMYKVGEKLMDAGKFKEALSVFNRLIKTHPDAAQVPHTYFRAAQIYYDRLMDAGKALAVMDRLLSKFPEHDMIEKFKTYREYVGRGGTAAAAKRLN